MDLNGFFVPGLTPLFKVQLKISRKEDFEFSLFAGDEYTEMLDQVENEDDYHQYQENFEQCSLQILTGHPSGDKVLRFHKSKESDHSGWTLCDNDKKEYFPCAYDFDFRNDHDLFDSIEDAAKYELEQQAQNYCIDTIEDIVKHWQDDDYISIELIMQEGTTPSHIEGDGTFLTNMKNIGRDILLFELDCN